MSTDRRDVFTGGLVYNMRSQQPQNRRAGITLGAYVLRRLGGEFDDIARRFVGGALYLFDDPLEQIQSQAVAAIAATGATVSSDVPALAREDCRTFGSLCTVSKVCAFESPDAFNALAVIVEASFETREQAIVVATLGIGIAVVPQFDESPMSTRKLLTRCVFAL
jgi:hypothetical protein